MCYMLKNMFQCKVTEQYATLLVKEHSKMLKRKMFVWLLFLKDLKEPHLFNTTILALSD